jgi:hypothetical protein
MQLLCHRETFSRTFQRSMYNWMDGNLSRKFDA